MVQLATGKGFEMIWSRIADKTPSIDVDRVTAVTRRVLSDKQTRDALARTVAQGRATYARFAANDAKSGLVKLARDAKTQEELGSLVRQVAATIDTGLARRPRRARLRRLGMFSALAVAVCAVVVRRRRAPAPPLVHERTEDVAQPVNGEVVDAERSIRI